MNVLITSASRKVWLVKAFQRALADEGGGQVIAADASPRSAALFFADKSYVVPYGLDDTFASAINHICAKHAIRLLIPTRDEELPFFAGVSEEMQRAGVTVMIPDLPVVRICQDKRLFVDFCRRNGFSVPETYDWSDADKVRFPVFLKERFGGAGKGTFIAESKDDLDCYCECMEEPVIQEYIEASEYTVDLFADFSGEVMIVSPRERIQTVGGESYIGRTSNDADLISESIRLARELGLKGHNTVQCFLDEGFVKFIEVNPRYGGGASLGFAAGACTPRYLVRLLLGRTVEPLLGGSDDERSMLRYTEDVFVSEVELNGVERLG